MKVQKVFLSIIWLVIIPLRADADSALIHTSGNVEVSVTDFGSLGAIRDGRVASNFKFPKSGNIFYLHERSEIWIGDANGNVASTWDLDPARPGTQILGNWKTTATGAVNKKTEPDGQQIITAQYDSTRLPGFPLNLLVDQQSFSWGTGNPPDADDFIVIKLIVTNNSNIDLKDIYIAIMANWDVDGTDLAAGQVRVDWVDWDEERLTLFTYDGDDTDVINPVHTALTLLDGKLRAHQIFTFRGFDGRLTGDLLVDASRSRLMSDPTAGGVTSKGDLEALGLPPWDYVSIISAGPYNIAARSFTTVTFALVAGEGLADLQKNIDEARRITFAPQRLTAEAVSGAVTLKWEASINPSVGGYTVLRRIEGESEFRQVGPRIVRGITFDDTAIENGVEHTYKVRPVDVNGLPLEFDSLEVRLTPDIIPDAPAGLTGRLSGVQVILNWTKSPQKVSGYLIYRNHTGREPLTQIASVPAEASSFVDVNVYPGLHYFYAIAATNRSGTSGKFSPVVDVLIPEQTAVPPESNLDRVVVAPNPYRLSANAKPLEFRNLTRRATIRIYTSAGELIKTIEHRNETPVEGWDGRNEEGTLVSAGIYVYHIESLKGAGRGKNSIRGKFAVIR